MARRKDGGGTTEDISPTYSVDTTTAARGSQSLKIRLGAPSRNPISSERTGLNPATLCTNFYRLDNFEIYDATEENSLLMDGDWSIDIDGLSRYFSPNIDVNDYNVFSFYSKADNPISIYVSIKGGDGIWTEKVPAYINNRFWKRHDVLIRASASNQIPVSMSEISFEFRGIAYSNVWLDDMYFVDLRTSSEKNTWISMNIHDENVSHQSEMVVGTTAGRRGDIVYGTYADNRRGTVAFRTHAPHDEEDIYFVENIKGNGSLCYFRNVGEGWPVYVESINAGINDTYFGSQRKLEMFFIEDTIE